MMFESLSAFMHMGGHGAFVWSAYSIALIVFGYNVVAPIRHRTSMLREVRRRLDREAQ